MNDEKPNVKSKNWLYEVTLLTEVGNEHRIENVADNSNEAAHGATQYLRRTLNTKAHIYVLRTRWRELDAQPL